MSLMTFAGQYQETFLLNSILTMATSILLNSLIEDDEATHK